MPALNLQDVYNKQVTSSQNTSPKERQSLDFGLTPEEKLEIITTSRILYPELANQFQGDQSMRTKPYKHYKAPQTARNQDNDLKNDSILMTDQNTSILD